MSSDEEIPNDVLETIDFTPAAWKDRDIIAAALDES